MDIILFTPRVWDSTWGQEKNLVEELARHHRIAIIDVIDYGMRYASKLQGQHYPVPENVTILKRHTKLQAGVLFGIYTELRNLWDFLKVGWRRSDVIITYFTAGVILTVLLAKCLRKKVLLIYADDYAEFFKSKSPLVAWFTEHIGTPVVAKFSNHVVTTAHKLKEDIDQFNAHVSVIPNGVHVQKIQRYREKHPHVTPSGVQNTSFTVGFVGGFGTWVDFDMVLKVATSLPDVHFKLIGSGDQFEEVSSRAQTLDNVWVPGILPYEKVLEKLRRIDICLIPFKINRITDRVSPIKLFEYWAMRKPVISTRFYEVRKIAEGKVVFVDNFDDLRDAILHLKKDSALRERIAEAGFREVENYDWTKLGQKYRVLVQQL
jgi:glycosyltransferase involved in cell wall biosynthesis